MTITKVSVFSFDSIDVDSFIDLDGTAWFHGLQICRLLGFKNPSVSIPQHTDDDERMKVDIGTLHDAWFLSESGFYKLVFQSKTENSKLVRRWLSHEVLPAIRKQGGYISPDATQTQLTSLQQQIETQLLAIETAYEVCKEMGDDRGMIETRSALLNLSNKINNTDETIPEGWLTISEILEKAGYKFNSKEMKTSLNQIGRKVRPVYEKETGKPVLVTSKHLNSGHSGDVKLYPPDWFEKITAIAVEYWKSKNLVAE
jgi:prophage antirepressor-like protein